MSHNLNASRAVYTRDDIGDYYRRCLGILGVYAINPKP